MRRIEVKNDYIFQKIFGNKGNEDILKGLLEAILDISIKEVEIIENTKLETELPEDKLGILDIRAKLHDGTKINVEVQLVNKKDMLERTLFYWAKLYTTGAVKGDQYKDMPKTVTINILDYGFLPENEYCLSAHLYYDKYKDMRTTDKLEMFFIDLVRFRKLVKTVESRLSAWLSFIDGRNQEMVDGARAYEEAIEKAEQILKEIEGNKEALRIYELTQKKIMDEASARGTGFEEGYENGKEEGREEGRGEGVKEVAKKLIKEGFPLEKISDITDLSIEELEALSD